MELTLDDFEVINKGKKMPSLGKGAYGEVKLVKFKKTNDYYALKIIKKSSSANKNLNLMKEVEIHKRLKHENIVGLLHYFEDEENLYLILEYASNGSLFQLIKLGKYLNEDEAFYFFIQACAGIYFLHSNGLIHGDIKPENMLIGNNNILKICDFGWCVATDHNIPRSTFCGTLEYMAPEMILNGSHNHTLDVWCLGVLLFELLHGHAPF